MAATRFSNESMAATTAITKLTPVMCYPRRINSAGVFEGDSPFDFSVPTLLIQVAVVNVITMMVRCILKPLGQPSIVSDVIGGILIGPSGLASNKLFADTVFPRRSFNSLSTGAVIGAVYYMFLIGVRQDIMVIVNSGRKAWLIAIVGVIIPITLMSTIFVVPKLVANSMENVSFMMLIIVSLSLTAFPTLHPILSDLNLLNSKLGRLAISAATNNNVGGWTALFIFGALRQGSANPHKGLMYLASCIALVIFIIFFIRPMMFWIIRRTPEGEPVHRAYIISILLGVLVVAFVSDLTGLTMTNGALLLGLAMPDGPPLGAALVEKTETIVQWFLLPMVYAAIGLKTNVYAIQDWKSWGTLELVINFTHLAKLAGTIVPCRYLKMPFSDSLSLGLMMNFRGFVELLVYVHLNDYQIMDDQSYTVLVLSTLMVTAIATPLAERFGRQSKLYTPYGLRTIEHLKLNAELRLMTCIHTEENVPTMINLIEASNARRESPVKFLNLNLVELVGRAVPMLISHNPQRKSSSSMMPHINQINNALYNYELERRDCVAAQCFTSVSPYITMHQDICMLAMDKKVSMIIVPFHKQRPINGSSRLAEDHPLRKLNEHILNDAPCSVGILVDRGHQHFFACNSWYRICVIFLGGADDREALSYAFRMLGHPYVRIDLVRILAERDDEDNERQRRLDERSITMFRMKGAQTERVVYREVIVNASQQTINSIRSLNNEYDLMIVGRTHECNSTVLGGLFQWCENPELGIIGDFLASSDFYNGMVSVLVIQQQINVGLVDLNSGYLNNSRNLRTRFAQDFQ